MSAEVVDRNEPPQEDDFLTPGADEVSPEGGKETSPAKKGVDLEKALADLAGTVGNLAKVKEPTPQPKQMTKEEEDEYFGVWNPTKINPNFVKEFFNLPDDVDDKTMQAAAQRLAQLQEGLVRQAVVSAQRVLGPYFKKLEERVKLGEDYVSQAQAEKTRGRFFEAYPGLNEPRFSKIISAISSTLADKDFEGEDDFFKALAEGAANHIKELIPDFDLAKPAKKPSVTTPRLPRSGAGGGGGAGNKGGDQKDKSGDESDGIFD